MRLLLQIFFLLLILFLGWDQPFRDICARVFPWTDIQPSRLARLRAVANPTGARIKSGTAEPAPASPQGMESTSSLNQRPPERSYR
jgi:hypothetical protein